MHEAFRTYALEHLPEYTHAIHDGRDVSNAVVRREEARITEALAEVGTAVRLEPMAEVFNHTCPTDRAYELRADAECVLQGYFEGAPESARVVVRHTTKIVRADTCLRCRSGTRTLVEVRMEWLNDKVTCWYMYADEHAPHVHDETNRRPATCRAQT